MLRRYVTFAADGSPLKNDDLNTDAPLEDRIQTVVKASLEGGAVVAVAGENIDDACESNRVFDLVIVNGVVVTQNFSV